MIKAMDKLKKNPNGNETDNKQQDEPGFGTQIAAFRKAKKLSQQQLADRLNEEHARLFDREPITNRAVSKWETGDSLPDAQQFISLCNILGIRDMLFEFRGSRAQDDPFVGLNKLGKERASEYISMLLENPRFSYLAPRTRAYRQIPLYDLPASAGTGVFLDGDSYTMIDADESVPEAATFAVRLSGDSMAPLFENGQTVYVRQQNELNDGDVGIFILDGEAYCKKLDTESGVRLISLNPKYKPIRINQSSELRIVGKVVL